MKSLTMLVLGLALWPCLDTLAHQTIQSFGQGKGGNINIAINVAETAPTTEVAPTTVNTTNQVVVPQIAQKKESLPLPPFSASMDPRRLIRYFCRMWKDENYLAMYYCMTREYRRSTSYHKFETLFTSDAGRTGGLDDENVLTEAPENGDGHLILVDLKFRRKHVPMRRVKAILEKTKDGYRLIRSGILPLDYENL